MKKILGYVVICLMVFSTVGVFKLVAFATAPEGHKVDICHKNGQSGNWNVLNVDENGWNGHGEHSDDFLYEGGDGNQEAWCADHSDSDDENNNDDEDDNDDEDNNDDTSTLIVKKVIVNNVENAEFSDFSFSVNGDDSVAFDGEDGINEVELEEGVYTVVESPMPANYTVSYENCSEVSLGDHHDDNKKFSNNHENDNDDEDEDDNDEHVAPICVITNTYVAPVDTCEADDVTSVIESSVSTQENGGDSSLVSYIHPAWVSSIASSVAAWIWGEDPIADPVNQVTETFTKTFNIVGTPKDSTLELAADNSFSVSVNGNVVAVDATEQNYGATKSYTIPASALVTGVNTVTFTVTNWAQDGGTSTSNPAGLIYKIVVHEDDCHIPSPTTATISAQKIVCDSEAKLPNWGNGGADITATTASDFLAADLAADDVQNCHLEPWTFEWAPNGTNNPGNNAGVSGGAWSTFTSTANVPAGSLVWVREVMQSGYVPFSGATTNLNDVESNNSAELYCSNDVLNYDNYDFIDPVVAGQTYHCIGFNALTKATNTCIAPVTTGGPESIVLGTSGEPSVQTILDTAGYTLDAQNDQTNVQEWDGTGNTVNFSVKYMGSQTGGNHVFGYYINNDLNTFVPLFQKGTQPGFPSVPAGVIGQDYTFSVPNATKVGFAISMYYNSNTYVWATKNSLNNSDGDHTVVYNPSANEYVISYEDLPLNSSDKDYNDTTVSVKVIGCEDNVPPPVYACSDDISNDSDGLVDANDPGCHSDGNVNNPQSYVPTDNDESNTVAECGDGIDNSDAEDSLVDSADPACHTDGNASNSESYDPNDTSETNNVVVVDQCPEGQHHVGEECVDNTDEEVTDVCPNLAGIQSTMPEGRHFNNSGNCVLGGSSGGSRSGGYTGGEVLGASICNWDVNTYMRKGYKNDAEQVKILQRDLLNGFMKFNLSVDGIFGPKTEEAVKAFQEAKKDKVLTPWNLTSPTGLFYKTTLVEAKNTICPEEILPIPSDLIPWSANRNQVPAPAN